MRLAPVAIWGRWLGLTGLNSGCGFRGPPCFPLPCPGTAPPAFWEHGGKQRVWAAGQWVACMGQGLEPAISSHQALAGPGLHDPLHHGAAGHAEAAGGVVAVPAQLPTGHDLLLGRAGARPAAAEGHLLAQPDAGGECPAGEGLRPGRGESSATLLLTPSSSLNLGGAPPLPHIL